MIFTPHKQKLWHGRDLCLPVSLCFYLSVSVCLSVSVSLSLSVSLSVCVCLSLALSLSLSLSLAGAPPFGTAWHMNWSNALTCKAFTGSTKSICLLNSDN